MKINAISKSSVLNLVELNGENIIRSINHMRQVLNDIEFCIKNNEKSYGERAIAEYASHISSSISIRDVLLTYADPEDIDFDKNIDVLYSLVDGLLSNNKFEECDNFIRNINVLDLDTNMLVAVLSITISARDNLKEYDNLLKRVESRLMELAPDRIDGLLIGLR